MMEYGFLRRIKRFIGFESNNTGHVEKWVSGTGALIGILAVAWISQHYVPARDAAWVVASMGATAVLVFAVPHGPLSQPWPVIMGHTVSALIGVACAQWIPELVIAAAIAVAVAITAMHYLQCIHPPGGATALTAVIGGEQLHSLGFQYVITPVLFNAVIMVLIAIAFNYAFKWRRYPIALNVHHRKRVKQAEASEGDLVDGLDESDLTQALKSINSIIDISGQDLLRIYRMAQQSHQGGGIQAEQLVAGQHYSNGLYGTDWQVRQIIDMPRSMKTADDLLIYKVIAGANRRHTGTTSFDDFARWARHEVFLNENSWQRKDYASELAG